MQSKWKGEQSYPRSATKIVSVHLRSWNFDFHLLVSHCRLSIFICFKFNRVEILFSGTAYFKSRRKEREKKGRWFFSSCEWMNLHLHSQIQAHVFLLDQLREETSSPAAPLASAPTCTTTATQAGSSFTLSLGCVWDARALGGRCIMKHFLPSSHVVGLMEARTYHKLTDPKAKCWKLNASFSIAFISRVGP